MSKPLSRASSLDSLSSPPTSESDSDLANEFIDPTPKPTKRKKPHNTDLDNPDTQRIIVQTSFDIYFTQNSTKTQTSDNVFSDLVTPLSPEEYAAATRNAFLGVSLQSRISSDPHKSSLFNRIVLELLQGFNVLAYGFGSKRRLLNQFAATRCAKLGHVIVVHGFKPDTTFKDLLSAIEGLPGVSDSPQFGSGMENQTRRISTFFADQRHHLFLILHNIDSAPFRVSKNKSCLASLALNPNIHLIASVDHINSPLLWSLSEATTRQDERIQDHGKLARGFSWLWHDMTTLESYDFELRYVDRTSLSSAHGGGPRKKVDPSSTALNTTTGAMSESAALHILASVTRKAKKLFIVLARKQLTSIEESEEIGTADPQAHGLGYDKLWNEARSEFIATNETSLRSLLGEFRDHNLVLSAPGGSGGTEILWIPMRKERLSSVLDNIQDQEDI